MNTVDPLLLRAEYLVRYENPAANIKRVAQACGYSEDTAFRRTFSQLMGMTPVQYRKWAMLRNDKTTTPDLAEKKDPV